ncbi:hypothetical protein [Pseudoroseicyclus sp. CXY001]|uniref:hypothetical protein n=1 Tax=Pseudoroseicyclus sp. CXY001 TaxID=3242492 RepID=UPI00357171AD
MTKFLISGVSALLISAPAFAGGLNPCGSAQFMGYAADGVTPVCGMDGQVTAQVVVPADGDGNVTAFGLPLPLLLLGGAGAAALLSGALGGSPTDTTN